MVVDPVTINQPFLTLGIKEKHNISGSVVEKNNQKLIGILTNRDISCKKNQVESLMTKEN